MSIERSNYKKEHYKRYYSSAGFKMLEEMKSNGFHQLHYGAYSCCSGAVILKVNHLQMDQSGSIDNVRRLMQIYTLPKFRGRGYGLIALEKIAYCSELSGCCVAAVANPFKILGIKEDSTDEDVARMLDDWNVCYDREETPDTMIKLMTKAGFSNWKIDPKYLENKSIGPDRCFIYIPGSVDRDFYKELKPAIVNENANVRMQKKVDLMFWQDLRNGINYR